jgi:hypothetical protein
MNSHIQIKNYFLEIAKIFEQGFGQHENKKLPFQKSEHEWLNFFYKSPIFRHIHLEYYKTDKICALHSTILPNPLVDFPVYGFDIIALGNKITGLFFDFTPTLTRYKDFENLLSFLKQNIKSPQRPLPEWATFFSDNFICIAPLEEEINGIFGTIKNYTESYLQNSFLIKEKYIKTVELQNKYCQGQKKNEKTFKALTAEIGGENAQKFFDEYLFPVIVD